MEVRGGGGYRFGPLAITLGWAFGCSLPPPPAGDTVDLDFRHPLHDRSRPGRRIGF